MEVGKNVRTKNCHGKNVHKEMLKIQKFPGTKIFNLTLNLCKPKSTLLISFNF